MINALEAPCQAPVSPWVPIMAGPLRLIYLQKSAEIPWNPMKSTKKGLKFKQLVLTAVKVLRWRLRQLCRPCPSRSCSGQALRVGKRWTDEWRINMTGSVSWRAHFFRNHLRPYGRRSIRYVASGARQAGAEVSKKGHDYRNRFAYRDRLWDEMKLATKERGGEMNQWISESLNQGSNESMIRRFNESTNHQWFTNESMNHWIDE